MELETFLQPMLTLTPEKRATAQEMLTHEWFDGVVVQGEIELEMAQMEKEEREKEEKAKMSA